MSVYKYENGAYTERNEVPKRYVDGAWQDTDGYAYENGAWVEKWGRIPDNYLIKDGVINPKYSYTIAHDGTFISSEYDWQYDSTERAMVSCRIGTLSSKKYRGDNHLKFTTLPYGNLKGKTVYLEAKVINGVNNISGERAIRPYMNTGYSFGTIISSSIKNTYSNTLSTGNDITWFDTILQINATNNVATTAYIYNLYTN